MRSPKLTLTIVSAILVLTGLVFIGLLSIITKGIWPEADAYAMNIGVVMRYILGASVIASGCILFWHGESKNGKALRKFYWVLR